MMPSGAPLPASHAGKRVSSGYIRSLPSGDQAQIASSTSETIIRPRPRRQNRVASRITPATPSSIMRFVGISMMPSVLEITKNKGSPAQVLVQRHTPTLHQSEDPHDPSSPAFQPRD